MVTDTLQIGSIKRLVYAAQTAGIEAVASAVLAFKHCLAAVAHWLQQVADGAKVWSPEMDTTIGWKEHTDLKMGPVISVHSKKMQCDCPAAPMPVTARIATTNQ